MLTIYLDACCLNRPFDDQRQDRIRLEAEAVLIVLSHVETGEWRWITSKALDFEIKRMPDAVRKARVRLMLARAHRSVSIGMKEKKRARQLRVTGFRSLDALHLACAESGGADVLLTTDDQLLRHAERVSDQLKLRVRNPLAWLREEIEK
ncbi:MAG: PIN domain-containing protein [Chloroflexi bacterium]|nr:PIN domain-containing protein [Chloroflexota bacterium]